ncbi:MAG: AHH domain-containing protein [Dehalobacter sp.]|nr:AHH domain-containing protein [Dehalobacter sp.]
MDIGDDIATANTGCGYVCQLRGEEKVGPLWRIVAAVSIVLPVSSTSLRKAMGIVDGSLDAHHLIPRAFSNHQFIRMATGAGWNIDHAYNGIALPKEIHGAIPGHPGYNDYVEEKLDELYNNAIVYGWSPDDAYEELMNLAQSLRIQIKQGQ